MLYILLQITQPNDDNTISSSEMRAIVFIVILAIVIVLAIKYVSGRGPRDPIV